MKDGNSSTFAGTGFEFMKSPYLGAHGHIAISTLNITRAIAWLARKGVRHEARDGQGKGRQDDRRLPGHARFPGFAIHLLQK